MSAFIQGGGDVFGPAGAVDGEIAVFNGATGKIIKSAGKNLNRTTFCLGANGVAAGGVGAAVVLHLDLLLPANLFTKDGDHIRVIGEGNFAANANVKNFSCNFAGTFLTMSAAYGAITMRNEWLIMRINSTQFRLSLASWRGSPTGVIDVNNLTAVTIDWGQPQVLNVRGSGAVNNDITIFTSLATFFPVP